MDVCLSNVTDTSMVINGRHLELILPHALSR
jgi:hypothetical protein